MLVCKAFSPEAFDPQQYVEAHAKLMESMQDYYKLPKVFKLDRCFCRKDLQLFLMVTDRDHWENFASKFFQTGSLEQYVQLILSMTWDHMRKNVEALYNAQIDYWCIFQPHSIGDLVYAYTVKIFDKPLFKGLGSQYGNTEDRFTRIASNQIRHLTGRGPKRITITILENKYMILSVFGIIPPFIHNYVVSHSENYSPVKELFASLLDNVIDHIFMTDFCSTPARLTHVDFEQNLVIAIVLLDKPLTE